MILKKNRKRILITLLLLSLVFAASTTFAFMYNKSRQAVNSFTPATVSCEVIETFDGTSKTSIKVKNTSNIDAYIRLNLSTHYVDADNNIVGYPSVIPEFEITSNWLKDGDTYYYKNPVSPGNVTDELLNSFITLKNERFNDKELRQVIEIYAEAVQSDPANVVNEIWK